MKYLFYVLLSLSLFACNTPAEKESHKPKISVQDWADTLDTENELGLFSEKYKVKEYTERNEKHALFFDAHTYTDESGKVFQDSLLASGILLQDEIQVVEWEMRDFIRVKETDDLPAEHHIDFWEEYMSWEDIDGDGGVEPVLVYGTSALNGLNDGRIKILTYHKGNKVAVRHQSGLLDFERNTQIDSAFYKLPEKIQFHVIQIMEKISKDKAVIFPYGWQTAMKEGKTYFDEN